MGTVLVGRDAMIAAGSYPPEHGPDMPEAIVSYLESIPGLDRRNILARLREQFDATKTITASFMGQITDSMEVSDNPTQLKAIELALRLHKLIGDDGQRINVGTVNILWAGGQPAWAKPSNEALVNASVNAKANDSASVLNSNETESTPAISSIEGTGRDPGPSPHTHSETLANRMVSRPSRTVKKRGPRLPVYRGPK